MKPLDTPLVYKSETKIWNNGAGAFAEWLPSSLETQGPNGGRVVIDNVVAHVQLVLTVAGAVIHGEDLYRFANKMSIKERFSGLLRYNDMPGDAQRLALYDFLGANMVKEHLDVPIAAGQTVNATIVYPFSKPHMREATDYAMAAELFESARMVWPQNADLSIGASVVTIASGSAYLIFECHEELDIVQHAVDEVKTQTFDTTTESNVTVGGRLQDLLAYVQGASGGASLANLTEIWVSYPQNVAPQRLVTPDLQERYARQRQETTGAAATQGNPVRSDPFTASTIRATAIILATDGKAYDQPVRDTAHVKTTQTAGGPGTILMIARVAKPRSKEVFEAIKRKYKAIIPAGKFRVKTASNTKRAASDWPADLLAYLPIKFTG